MYAVGSQRALFDIPQGVAYFNAASNAPQLNASRARLLEAVGKKSRPWERVPSDFFTDAERIRQLAAALFGADSDGWAVIPAASYGISAAARAIEPTLKPGDRILVMAEESNDTYNKQLIYMGIFRSFMRMCKKICKNHDASTILIR